MSTVITLRPEMDQQPVQEAHDECCAEHSDVIEECRAYLADRIIPRLPLSCEWRWVVVHLERALARQLQRAATEMA